MRINICCIQRVCIYKICFVFRPSAVSFYIMSAIIKFWKIHFKSPWPVKCRSGSCFVSLDGILFTRKPKNVPLKIFWASPVTSLYVQFICMKKMSFLIRFQMTVAPRPPSNITVFLMSADIPHRFLPVELTTGLTGAALPAPDCV